MTLLSIIQDVAVEIGIPRPTAVVGSTNPTVRQLLRLANKEGKALSRRANWQALQREDSFTTVAASLQTTIADITSDFDRIVNDTMWNRSTDEPVRGPLNAQQWQRLLSSPVQTSIGYQFRIWQKSIYLYPTPTAGQDIYFEYMTNQWCESEAGAGQTGFLADTDVFRLNEELMTLGLVWRWLKRKGLSYAEEFNDYELAVESELGIDGGKEVIDFTGQQPDLFAAHIPEGDWDQS